MVIHYDVGDGQLPEWIPRLPGAHYEALPTYYDDSIERTGRFLFSIDTDPMAILCFYREVLNASGFFVDTDTDQPFGAQGIGESGGFTAVGPAGKKVSVQVARESGALRVVGHIGYRHRLTDGFIEARLIRQPNRGAGVTGRA
jgi:hypothetical protein